MKVEIKKRWNYLPNLKFYIDILRDLKLTQTVNIIAHSEGIDFLGPNDVMQDFIKELEKHKEIKFTKYEKS